MVLAKNILKRVCCFVGEWKVYYLKSYFIKRKILVLYGVVEFCKRTNRILQKEGEKCSMKWVVLSDLHMQIRSGTTEIAREKLIETLKEEREKGEISFILLTGDCMNKHEGELEKIKNFIMQIADACGVDNKYIFICPGNHDIDRSNSKRKRIVNYFRSKGTLPKKNEYLAGYGEFNTLFNSVTGRFYKPFSVESINNFKIITVDSCLLSLDDKDSGRLAVFFPDLTNLSQEIKKDDTVNIVIMHHGVEWLRQDDAKRFQHWLADNNISVVFCGHNHAPGVNILTEGIKGDGVPRDGILQFTSGCGFFDNDTKAVFFIGEYMEGKSIEVKLYEYMDDSRWNMAGGILRSFPEGVYRESLTNGLICNSYDIPRIYDTIFDIDDVVAQELKVSKRLDFFGLRGSTFLKGKSKIANTLYERKGKIDLRLLVSDPYNHNIDKRLRNVPEFAQQANLEQQWKVIYGDIKRLRDDFPKIPSWSIRFHEQPILFRFIMTEQSVYIGYYTREPSSKSCIYRYTNQSSLYRSLRDFFDSTWGNADTNFNQVVPDRCSFVLDKFDMKPSLVINLASACNMKCRYCPEGGENLKECAELCDIIQIKYLLTAYADYYKEKKWKEKKVVRITGGEPLLYFERIEEVLKHAKAEEYEKIVLCTNGTFLKEAYENNPKIWESVKNILLLKISLDSLNEKVFEKLTKSEKFDTVIQNIEFAKSKGFKIELNLVATKDNVKEIASVYNYAYQKGLVGLKVLTINDFGGRKKTEDVEDELKELMKEMRRKHYVETGLYVHNNKGIHMKRFIHDGCTLTIVDHMNKVNSVTPRRTYSVACKSCKYYPESREVKAGKNKPCATGIMSLTMRADGMLSFCRMETESDTYLAGKKLDEVKEMVNIQLKRFEECYHYEVGENR